MATNIGELSARVSLDTAEFTKNMAMVRRETKTAKADFELAGKGIDTMGKSVDKNAGQMAALSRQIEATKKEINQYSDRYKEAAKEVGASGGTISKAMQDAQLGHAKARLEAERLTEQYRELFKQNARSESEFYKSGVKLEAFGTKMETVGGKMTRMGDKWTKVGIVIGGATGVMLKQFIDWESSVASMEKTIDNSDGTVDRLAESFRELSKEIPKSASDLNELAATAGQLGIESDSIEGFVRVMADLGETTNISSEEAGVALAQFANITQMAQGDFDRLGSTIVDLGNHFATQEEPIVDMAQRLAAAGTQIGLTESDIVAVSTALSSLGVRAESGGSSFSKLMINMQLAAVTGLTGMQELEESTGMTRRELELLANHDGKSFKAIAESLGVTTTEMNKTMKAAKQLEGFSEIAGMTAEEFKKAFEEDAVNALGAFVSGLGNAEEQGSSAIEMLDEMGISEIRLRDTLLRAGNAQELFNDAVDMGSKAWDENTALTEEANLRYETSASKIKVAKNQIQDLAIEMGGQLMPVLADFMDKSQPIVTMLSEWIEKFANTSDETKKFAVAALGITIIGGPILSTLGRVTTGLGGMTKGLGKGMKALFDFKVEGKVAGKSVEQLGKLALGSSTKMLALSPAVIGVTAAVVLGYGAWKIWGEKAYEASERTKKWGSDVGEEAGKALDNFTELSEGAALATDQMAVDIEGGAKKAIKSYTDLTESVKESITETSEESGRILSEMPEEVRKIVEKSVLAAAKEQEKLVAEIDKIQSSITGIYEKAMEENREVTSDELAVIENYHSRLAEIRSETLELSAEEQKNVHSIMLKDLETFSRDQLMKRLGYLKEEKDALGEHYQEQKEFQDELFLKGKTSQEEYNQAMSILRKEENQDMKELGAEYVKVWDAQGVEITDVHKKILEDMGTSYEEVKHYLNLNVEAVDEANSHIVRTSETASKKVREANNVWNELVLQGGDALRDFIQDANANEESWNNLQYALHYAELDTNSQDMIQEAMVANGTWWDLDFFPKWAELGTNVSGQAKSFLESLGIWEGLDYKQQNAILETNSPEQLEQILKDFGIWEGLEPKLQEFITQSNAKEKSREGVESIKNWNKEEAKKKELKVGTNANDTVSYAQGRINSLTGKSVDLIVNRKERTYRSTMDAGITGALPIGYASGTNFHKGGAAILGDGGNHEPYLTPDGSFGISPNKDTMYDLPKGTKVWRNIQALLDNVPKYANGTRNQPIQIGDKTFNQLSDALIPFSSASRGAASQQTTNNISEGDVFHIHLSSYGNLPNDMVRGIAENISKEIKRNQDKRNMARGERVAF